MGTLLFHDTHDMIEKRVNGDEKRENFGNLKIFCSNGGGGKFVKMFLRLYVYYDE